MNQQLTPAARPVIDARQFRVTTYHKLALEQATRFKLVAFLLGMELRCLQFDLGIQQGKHSSDIVSDELAGRSWDEFVEQECGFTGRTARRYMTAYDNIHQACPKVAARLVESANAKLADREGQLLAVDTRPMSMEAAIGCIPENDLHAFCTATDDWTLADLYQRPMKRAQAVQAAAAAAEKSAKRDKQAVFDFWFEDFTRRAGDKTYLRLPTNHRKQLLERIEIMAQELKASLKGARR